MERPSQFAAAEAFLYHEAHCLDTRRWNDWLDLFDEQGVFWVPTWRDDGEPTADPYSELSLIFCSSREQLRERVERAAGGRSIASLPPMRTAHSISNVTMLQDAKAGEISMRSVCTVHVFNIKKREQNAFFTLQEHTLTGGNAGQFKIARKKALLLNDYIPRMIDFYTI